MTLSPSLLPRRLATLTAEADSLAERLRVLSREALSAAREGNLPGVSRILRERAALVHRLAPILEAGRIAQHASAATPAPENAAEISRGVGRLLQTMRGIQAIDTRLMEDLRSGRDAVLQELDGVGRRASRESEYGVRSSRAGKLIDLLR